MNIGELAASSGVSAKMIRHYEQIGLIAQADRTSSGYRIYGSADVHTLRFVRKARALGFSIKQVEQLLELWRNRRRSSAKVKELAQRHIASLDAKIQELATMKQTLEHLVRHCHGDSRPECPILAELGTDESP
jgi:Cu(I)-responsive transcriptional regulator